MKVNKVIIGLIIISLLCGSFLLVNKISSERSANNAEVVLSYKDIEALSEQSDETVDSWLTEFKKMGASSVAIEELKLKDLVATEKALTTKMLDQLNVDNYWQNYYPEEAIDYILSDQSDKHDVIIETKDVELYQFIHSRVAEIYPEELSITFSNDQTNLIILDGGVKDSYYQKQNVLSDFEEDNIRREEKIVSSKLLDIGLGFDEDIIGTIEKLGMNVILRPTNYSRYAKEKLEYFTTYVEDNNISLKYLIFVKEALGHPNVLEELEEFLVEKDIIPVVIETSVQRSNIEQDGLEEVVEKMDYQTVRLFSTFNYIQKRYEYFNYEKAEEIENTFYRAITERNIRLIYFKPFKKNEKIYVTDVKPYQELFQSLEERLSQHNITYGNAKPFDYNKPSFVLILLTGVGVIAVSVLLFEKIFSLKEKYLWWLLGVGVIGYFLASYLAPNLSLTLMAFMTSIVFSVASGYLLIHYLLETFKTSEGFNHRLLYRCIFILLGTTFVSILGGLYINSFLSHTKFILEMEFYRGVKLSLILPVLIFTAIYILKIGYKRPLNQMKENQFYIEDLKRLLNTKIKVMHLALIGVIGILGYIYIARTGHETAIKVSGYEIMFRNFLERHLIARPRSKEFLIAFPSVMMAVYFVSKRIKPLVFPFAFVGMIGYTSVINTFCHLRAPIYLSFYRTIIGLGFGIILGAIGIYVFDFIYKYFRRFIYE